MLEREREKREKRKKGAGERGEREILEVWVAERRQNVPIQMGDIRKKRYWGPDAPNPSNIKM